METARLPLLPPVPPPIRKPPSHPWWRSCLLRILLVAGLFLARHLFVASARLLPRIVAERMGKSWIDSAQSLRTGKLTVYYHGQAEGGYLVDGRVWAGVIRGEVLVLTEKSALACPEVRLDAEGGQTVTGSSATISVGAGDEAPWRGLLTTDAARPKLPIRKTRFPAPAGAAEFGPGRKPRGKAPFARSPGRGVRKDAWVFRIGRKLTRPAWGDGDRGDLAVETSRRMHSDSTDGARRERIRAHLL